MELETIKSVSNDVIGEFIPVAEPIDINFQNLSYSIQSAGKSKHILNDISGSFRSGEVTAILGPSGAGKTSLLNILVGFVASNNAEGIVNVNGEPRNPHNFRYKCAYITQDPILQKHLTVAEAMDYASRLKVAAVTDETRQSNIENILKTLGIDMCVDTMCDVLSGGQKKRLTIALELVSNPSVLFLDEPTTGLDNHASKIVLNALNFLAKQGRTIVCTIHQPSPLEFQAYDNVFVIAKGHCVYTGPPSQLVPFLHDTGLPCPQTYSPADYIIELIQLNPENIDRLAKTVATKETELKYSMRETKIKSKSSIQIPPGTTKFRILLSRMMLQQWRNRRQIYMQVVLHIVIAFLCGTTYHNIGNNAEEFIQNIKLGLLLSLLLVYIYSMLTIVRFPLDFELLKCEYFNNWYGALTYTIAVSLSNIPFMFLNIIFFASITYVLTAIPWELNRFIYYILLSFLTAYASDGVGMFIGSLGNVKTGCVIGPPAICALYVISCYGIGFGRLIEPTMHFVMNFVFFRYVVAGYWQVIFGMNREPFPCYEIYCPFTHWKTTLKDIGVDQIGPWHAITLLAIFALFHRFICYVSIRYKLEANILDSKPHLIIVGVANKFINQFRRSG